MQIVYVARFISTPLANQFDFDMLGYSLIRKKELMAIYNKIAIFALDKIRHQNKFNMEIKGKVIQALPIEGGTSKSGNQWSKASLIVEVAENPQYP